MKKKNELPIEEYEDYNETTFEDSVKRFADAFFELTEEERNELIAYVEGRCKEAEEDYKKRNK